MADLAIIIPAYKLTYFEEALNSLAQQTCKDFNVYVGDDCSPFNLKEVVDSFSGKLQIFYTRFSSNIGSKDIVRQWERSVGLSKDEKWIWLFSDDDVADPTCVESFFKIQERNKGRFDVYRFNTVVIDEKGNFIRKLAEGATEETSEELAYFLLNDQRGIAMQDHIFSRQVYLESGGLVFTEYAQGADWATSILFSSKNGIAVIPDSKLYWRLSSSNITGSALLQKSKMFPGHLQFISWILKHFAYLKSSTSTITYAMIRSSARFNLLHVVINHYKGLTTKNLLKIIPFMRKELRLTFFQIANDLHYIFVSTTSTGRRYLQFRIYLKERIQSLFSYRNDV